MDVIYPRCAGLDVHKKSLRRCEVLIPSGGMPTCPHCQRLAVTRDGHDRHPQHRRGRAMSRIRLIALGAVFGLTWAASLLLARGAARSRGGR